MKAAVYYETGKPDVFKYEEAPDPKCGAMQVLIEVKVVSIEGGDVLNRAGGDMAGKPHIVGYQCAGVIREAGSAVTDRKVGDNVVAIQQYGSHAELVVANPLQTWLIPDGMDMQQAACIPIPYGTASDCLFEFGHLKAGESVLIQAGAGGVGLAAIQLAKKAGATVQATASSDERLERLKEYGMDHGINYRSENWIARSRELAGGRGVDLVVDSVGTTLEGSIAAAAYRGRIVTVGNAGRSESRNIDVQTLSAMNKSLTGVFFGGDMMMNPTRARGLVESLINDVAKGGLRVVIDRTYPLSEAAKAHEYIESRQAFGRVLLIP
jgi:NADPH2:quinone reductase